ncbi:MAG TPA: hypothetical protein VEK08_25710 [Planctomycetota bacterium]|nr:hypothetical protein [Planctomycetota bacterium]
MSTTKSSLLCTGMAIGAALTLIFDPSAGRRRRSLLRDKGLHYASKVQRSVDVILHDARNRMHGFMAGDFSVKKFDLLQPTWAPSTRFLAGLAGAGLMAYGMSRGGLKGAAADLLGAALLAEGVTNATMRQRTQRQQHAPQQQPHPKAAETPAPVEIAVPATEMAATARIEI